MILMSPNIQPGKTAEEREAFLRKVSIMEVENGLHEYTRRLERCGRRGMQGSSLKIMAYGRASLADSTVGLAQRMKPSTSQPSNTIVANYTTLGS